jgi:hypothetical protein
MKETDHPWISISFDETEIIIKYAASDYENYVKKLKWGWIVRICYKSYDDGAPDFLYVSLKNKDEKYIIPITEKGGNDFWEEVKNRGLFDQKLAIIAEESWNQIFCWPD